MSVIKQLLNSAFVSSGGWLNRVGRWVVGNASWVVRRGLCIVGSGSCFVRRDSWGRGLCVVSRVRVLRLTCFNT